MAQPRLFPNWKEIAAFDTDRPRHQELIATDAFRAVLVGLEAGQEIPAHPTSAAAYHFLEGSGWMIVGGERLRVEAGATVVVPSGVRRGVEAETRLAFLGTQAAMHMPKWGPLVKYGPLIMFGAMLGFMVISAFMLLRGGGIGLAMLRMMMSPGTGGLGQSMLGAMLLAFLGMLTMLVLMFAVTRRMGGSGPMSAMMMHEGQTTGMQGHRHVPQSQSESNTMTTVTYAIPAVHCPHCKMTIERRVGELPGVDFVQVDVDAQQAVIRLGAPATTAEIEALLAEIGYPPEMPLAADV